MKTVFTSHSNAELIFEVSLGTFTEDPNTLNMISDTREELIKCFIRQPTTRREAFKEPGNDEKSFIVEGHAVEPKYFPVGLRIGNVGKIKILDATSDCKEEGLFEILELQQSAFGIVAEVKGHRITGRFTALGSGGIGNG